MPHEIPSAANFTGLPRKVLEYSEAFMQIVARIKQPDFSDADWQPLEKLVNVDTYTRQGVFLTDKTETIDWSTYKTYITQYSGGTQWEATLRHITEKDNHVMLELEERNTRDGFTHIAKTVTTYDFDNYGKIERLEVYVMALN